MRAAANTWRRRGMLWGVATDARAVLNELEGLRALARSLVHGDADADDLIQDTAAAALAHPPADLERPVRGWLATVLRNRWRMDRRAAARREARELVELDAGAGDDVPGAIDRARALEKLSAALVALDEPFRTTVIRRYLDGETAAEIARALRVPAGTVRWRLKTGLDRLRAAMDDSSPRWQRALAPLVSISGAAMKTKTTTTVVAILILLLVGIGAVVWKLRGGDATAPGTPASQPVAHAPVAAHDGTTPQVATPELRDPLPGQGKPRAEVVEAPGGVVSGRVINWSTGSGVEGAELTFTSDGGAATVRSGKEGGFELAPAAPGSFTLSAIAAPGFLPYAPELLHSTVHLELAKARAVRGITVFLFPAVDYHGKVVDARGAPATEWTSDKAGQFVFHAADEAVLEAVHGNQRGWGVLDGKVAISHLLTIAIGDAPAHDLTISGRTIDASGAPLADVLIRAEPNERHNSVPQATAFATSGADGSFTMAGLAKIEYDLAAETEDHAPAGIERVAAGNHNVTLTLDAGKPIAGNVVTSAGDPVPAYTLLVFRRAGVGRDLIAARSVVEPAGKFTVRVEKGDYELVAAASGWAPTAPTTASAGDTGVKLTVSAGATLRGRVVGADDNKPLGYARIMREAVSGGASAQPANAGTVTREDGTFELTGIPPGALSITVGAGNYNPKIESGMTAVDGATIGPITIALTKLAEGEEPKLELVGIGIGLTADGDALLVQQVFPGSGAESAGIVVGDRVTAVDGVPVTQIGLSGAISRIRGVVGTTVGITLHRGDKDVPLVVERRKLKA